MEWPLRTDEPPPPPTLAPLPPRAAAPPAGRGRGDALKCVAAWRAGTETRNVSEVEAGQEGLHVSVLLKTAGGGSMLWEPELHP